jgi:hypothetical protein
MATISDQHDNQIKALMAQSGQMKPAQSEAGLLTGTKNYLDANFAQYRDPYTGQYSANHVQQALLTVRTRGLW